MQGLEYVEDSNPNNWSVGNAAFLLASCVFPDLTVDDVIGIYAEIEYTKGSVPGMAKFDIQTFGAEGTLALNKVPGITRSDSPANKTQRVILAATVKITDVSPGGGAIQLVGQSDTNGFTVLAGKAFLACIR